MANGVRAVPSQEIIRAALNDLFHVGEMTPRINNCFKRNITPIINRIHISDKVVNIKVVEFIAGFGCSVHVHEDIQIL
jgi:hypothetical protein